MNDDELIGRFQAGLCLRTREEVEHEIALVREQTRLVAREVQLIEEEHEHSERAFNVHRRTFRPLTSATILQFSPRKTP